MKFLISIVTLVCAGLLSAQDPVAVPEEGIESQVRESLLQIPVPESGFDNVTVADAVKSLKNILATAGSGGQAVKVEIVSRDPMVNMTRVTLERKTRSVMDLIHEVALKSGSMVLLEGQSIEFKSRNCYVKPLPEPLSEKSREVRRTRSEMIIPRVDFQDVTLGRVLYFLRVRNADTSFTRPRRMGPSIIMDPAMTDTKISVYALNISDWNLMHLIAERSGAVMEMVDGVIEFRSKDGGKGQDVLVGPQGKAMRETSKMVLQTVSFDDATLEEAIVFLDRSVREREELGLGLTVDLGEGVDPKIKIGSLEMDGIAASEAIYYVAKLTGTRVRSTEKQIIFVK